MEKYILVINPGSTSTKIAVYCNELAIIENKINHSSFELQKFSNIISQSDFRKQLILDILNENNFEIRKLDAICGRGGLLRPLESGTYLVNEKMLYDLKDEKRGQHASNLGAIIAYEIAEELNIPTYIVDPVAVDELDDIARISGMPLIERTSIFHALNHKSIARKVAKDYGYNYNDINLIIAHLGGGVTVAAHKKGRVVDTNNGLDGEGPMSPERSGSVPIGPLYNLCFSGKYTLEDIRKMNYGRGGLVGYLGTNDVREIVERINNGDEYAKFIFDAMIYQIGKEIGACSAVLKGKVNYIVLTGGMAHQSYLVEQLKEMVGFISKILVYPGEDEMLSLAQGALRVLYNEEQAKEY